MLNKGDEIHTHTYITYIYNKNSKIVMHSWRVHHIYLILHFVSPLTLCGLNLRESLIKRLPTKTFCFNLSVSFSFSRGQWLFFIYKKYPTKKIRVVLIKKIERKINTHLVLKVWVNYPINPYTLKNIIHKVLSILFFLATFKLV